MSDENKNKNEDKKQKLLTKFKMLVKQFLDELLEQFPSESDLIVARVMFIDQIPTDVLVTEFSKRVLPYREHIKSRNEKFFLEEMKLFENVNQNKVVKFKELWKSDKLDNDDKSVIWKWFDVFVNILDKYNAL